MNINGSDREFIESHKVYFEQARMKFLHGFAPGTMDRFYEIYKRHINPGYVLTPWCSECVIDMVARLGTWYAQMQDNELLAVQAGADMVAAREPATWPEATAHFAWLNFNESDKAPGDVIPFPERAEQVAVKSAGNSLDAPEKRGKGRPKKVK
jgi:hypothetical protein